MRYSSIIPVITGIAHACLLLIACSTPGPGLFTRSSPHELYGQHLTSAGLRETALGRAWFQAAVQSLASPLTVSLPYLETGYFAAERPQASAVQFNAKRGEKIHITLSKKPDTGFLIYLDLWEPAAGSKPKLLASADTLNRPVDYEVKADGAFIVRVQPELLKSGEYSLTVTTGPSLAFPLPVHAKGRIGSFWGAGRDNGARKHEGIDIFAPFRTPALAAAPGIVTRVEENTLGGKVVFLNPYQKNYSLYYAHLDTQLVHSGQTVATGDTLGLTGNTGNAKYTPSHLHFGIYTMNGAVDPLPFVNPVSPLPARITAPLENLNMQVRTARSNTAVYDEPDTKHAAKITLEGNTLLRVEAAAAGWYKVLLPDGAGGFVNSAGVSPLSNPVRRITLVAPAALLDAPDSLAPRKKVLRAGESIHILAGYQGYYYVSAPDNQQGWINREVL